jgi:hypothetical protein
MSRGWIVYIFMFALLGVGLWAVMRVGATLRAPTEIAGTRKVRWETESPTGEAREGTLAVDQSGQFCTFHFDGQRRSFSMKMIGGTVLGDGGAGVPVARLEGDGHQITLYSTAVQDSLRLELDGRDQYRALIDRVSRPGDELAESDSPKPAPVADARP